MPTLEDAIALALEAHRGQKDRAGEPYILHPLRVMFRLGWDAPEAARIAAVLHDVVEDTRVKLHDLRKLGYSEEVLATVELLSLWPGDSYEQFIERVLPEPDRADGEAGGSRRQHGAAPPVRIDGKGSRAPLPLSIGVGAHRRGRGGICNFKIRSERQ